MSHKVGGFYNEIQMSVNTSENIMTENFPRLPIRFYRQDSRALARALLGRILVRRIGRTLLSGRIVETEAYGGFEDRASHAFGGQSPRNKPMFAAGGSSYVYFIYGSCFCFNVVSGKTNQPQAVLIRALEPLSGIAKMARFRPGFGLTKLCNGPGKLCQALSIDQSLNSVFLDKHPRIWLSRGTPVKDEHVMTSPRVGLSDRVGKARAWPWRFYLKNSPYVSRSVREA